MADIGLLHHLLIALGIGLLIGAERERRKAQRPSSTGLRSFTIASVMGCASALTPWDWMVAVVLVCITALALFSNWQRRSSDDPGITTEIALIATPLLGARLGVPMLGLVSGFISSSATIGAMGAWVRANPASVAAGVAAAVLSTVANYVQMAVVINLTDHRAFLATAAPVGAAALAAALSGGWFMLAAWRETSAEPPTLSRSFNVMIALVFAAMLAGMLILVAAMEAWFGTIGIAAAAAIGGVLDVHAAVISIATLVGEQAITPAQVIVPVLIACTTSSIAKMLFAATAGTKAFAARVIPAQAGIVVASWLAGLAALQIL